MVAGDGTSTVATLAPLAGFAAPVSVTCVVATAATASSCNLPTTPEVPPQTLTVSLMTTSQYTVIGYGGLAWRGILWPIAVVSGWLLWRAAQGALRAGLAMVVLAAIGLSMTGCPANYRPRTPHTPDQAPIRSP